MSEKRKLTPPGAGQLVKKTKMDASPSGALSIRDAGKSGGALVQTVSLAIGNERAQKSCAKPILSFVTRWSRDSLVFPLTHR
jgi:hypothetical protein